MLAAQSCQLNYPSLQRFRTIRAMTFGRGITMARERVDLRRRNAAQPLKLNSCPTTAEGPTTSPTTSRSGSCGFREESWAELNRCLETHPETVRRWRDKGVRSNVEHMLALLELANSLGLGHIPLEFRPDADDGPTAPTQGPGAWLRATLGTSRTGAGTT